ncbi:MAG TPA: DUF5674 family protein [Candidatus Limnocylindrales bacterium]|nr:DUF5674 family protein [Candidatus Limnocylindrales bacterium]
MEPELAEMSEILILLQRIEPDTLRRLVEDGFEDMVKFVADLGRGRIAIGGELHADAEALLLESGSRGSELWGANYYPGKGSEGCIEYISLINIRPAQENPGMAIANPAVREQVRELAHRLIGRGEDL